MSQVTKMVELSIMRPTMQSIMAFFTLEEALSVWTNFGKHSLLVWLYVSSIKMGTRRIIHLLLCVVQVAQKGIVLAKTDNASNSC